MARLTEDQGRPDCLGEFSFFFILHENGLEGNLYRDQTPSAEHPRLLPNSHGPCPWPWRGLFDLAHLEGCVGLERPFWLGSLRKEGRCVFSGMLQLTRGEGAEQ